MLHVKLVATDELDMLFGTESSCQHNDRGNTDGTELIVLINTASESQMSDLCRMQVWYMIHTVEFESG